MTGRTAVWGLFDRPDPLVAAYRRLQSAGYAVTIYTPAMTPHIADAVAARPSAVRWFSLAGGMVGAVGGLWLTIWSAGQWGTITGGKPVISVPPFLIVAFEFTILFGALATILGFLLLAGLPTRRRTPEYDPSFSVDRFALRVVCPPEHRHVVIDGLLRAGAVTVREGTSPDDSKGKTMEDDLG